MTGYVLLFAALALATAFDIRKRKIPDAAHVLLFFSGMLFIFADARDWRGRLAGFLVIGITMLAVGLWLGNLGGGDIKMGACLGFALGILPASYAILAGLFLVAIVCAVKNRVKSKSEAVPLAPFFSIGCAAVFLSKEVLLNA